MDTLHNLQQEAGATFETVIGAKVATSFRNDAQAIQAAHTGVALCDRTHWGRLQVSDQDRLIFLHNQSTNDFKKLLPGQGCDTVFVTSTARTLDLASAYVTQETVILLVSPNRRQKLLQWLDRYIFFGDKVQVTDITDTTAAFSLLGPESKNLLEKLGVAEIPSTYGSHILINISGMEVRVAVGSGLATKGYTLITNADQAAALWHNLEFAGAVPIGEQCWEQLRIEQGRPKPDYELTEDYNPLEAGLWQAISLNKGCYIGQETIARLNTYQGVKQQLWGVKLTAPVEAGTTVKFADNKVGNLTSYTKTANGFWGLAYVKTKVGGAGLKVQVGETEGELVDLPFLRREPQN
jgi:hypothetical protein